MPSPVHPSAVLWPRSRQQWETPELHGDVSHRVAMGITHLDGDGDRPTGHRFEAVSLEGDLRRGAGGAADLDVLGRQLGSRGRVDGSRPRWCWCGPRRGFALGIGGGLGGDGGAVAEGVKRTCWFGMGFPASSCTTTPGQLPRPPPPP